MGHPNYQTLAASLCITNLKLPTIALAFISEDLANSIQCVPQLFWLRKVSWDLSFVRSLKWVERCRGSHKQERQGLNKILCHFRKGVTFKALNIAESEPQWFSEYTRRWGIWLPNLALSNETYIKVVLHDMSSYTIRSRCFLQLKVKLSGLVWTYQAISGRGLPFRPAAVPLAANSQRQLLDELSHTLALQPKSLKAFLAV